MAQWNRSESGILRKFKKKDNFEDLLVFGYACKIFRDDEKALYIDQGKHLIPWMGDERLKIDRYDCRGHLSEIKHYEANPAGYNSSRWLGLDENERKLEQMCDEERYYALTINEEEDEMYKEEERKRIQTNEFQYSYDVPMQPEQERIPTVPENDEDEAYAPPPGLDIPPDIPVPSTMKEFARIEKTAMFVSTQGPQMEILIKAKQANNSQFNFLGQKDSLYKFYRHILNAIKSGRFKKVKSDDNSLGASENESGETYLHPSLVSSTTTSNMELPLPAIPTVPYRPSVNCTYSQLVNRIQSTAGDNGAGASSNPTYDQHNFGPDRKHPAEDATFDQQQYYQYYMHQQYYDYYNHITQNSGADAQSDPKLMQLHQMAYNQYLHQSSQTQPNPYAQIVSNVNRDVPKFDFATEKPDISKEAVLYNTKSEPKAPILAPVKSVPIITSEKPIIEPTLPEKTSLLSLIQNYNSDSDGAASEDEQIAKDDDFEMPNDEMKVVIDKMATYVVKNGKEFEEIVKSRSDPRFVFLDSDNKYNKYYQKKVAEETKLKEQPEHTKEGDADETDESKSSINKAKEKKVIAPVSFSIKKMKEEVPKEIKSALPVDEETDEETENVPKTNVSLPVLQPPTLVSSSTQKNVKTEPPSKEEKQTEQLINEKSSLEVEAPVIPKEEIVEKTVEKSTVKENSKSITTSDEDVSSTNVILVKDDPILEMIDLTVDIYNEKDSSTKDNNSECCVIDDVNLLSNDEKSPPDNRALQLERRRKATAFLKLKTASSSTDQDSSSSSSIKRKKRRSCDSLDEDIKCIILDIKDDKYSKDSESKHSTNIKGLVQKEIYRSGRSKNEKKVAKLEFYELSDVEDSKNSDKSEGRSRKSHKKKKSHKRKRSKCKHRSKTKKRTKKKDSKYISTSSSDTDSSYS